MIKRLLNSKTKLMIFIGVILMVIMGVSYSTFTFVTQDYKASELLIAELNYGIEIIKDEGDSCSVEGTKVTTSPSTECFITIEISSVNPINSRYVLAYKNIEGDASVEYTDKTQWGSSGIIEDYNRNYIRKVRVVIDNKGKNSEAETDFRVYGGYTFNSKVSIDLKDGYVSIPGVYEESIEAGNKKLVDIVEEDTNCVTNDNKECLYGGGVVTNYLQYPTSDNTSDNLWRITGSYELDGKVYAKIVYNSNYNGNTSKDNVKNVLDSFYNSLDKASDVIEDTNKFNCTKGSCVESIYSKMGLLSTYEYNEIGGYESYLGNTNNWFALDNGNIKNITSKGIEEASGNSGVRPVAYLQSDVTVTGKGTIEDPYRISPKGDINLVAWTLDGQATDKTFEQLLETNVISNITCPNGTNAKWSYEDNSIKLTDVHIPDNCTIDFGDGYVVTVEVKGGNVQPSSVTIGGAKDAKFKITADDKYVLVNPIIICDGGSLGEIDVTGNLTIKTVKQSQKCTVTLRGKVPAFVAKLKADNTTIKTRTSFSSTLTTAGLYQETDIKYLEEDGRIQDVVYYFAGPVENNWVKFGQEDGQDIWWRIIRTNEDGSVRLLYAGKGTNGYSSTSGHIGKSAYNSCTNTKCVGYMYGEPENGVQTLTTDRKNTTSSTIKTKVDKWYDSNMTKTDTYGYTYGSYLSRTAVYCNDRATSKYSLSSSVIYAAYYRLVNAKRPSFKCGNNETGELYDGPGTNDTIGGANVADRFTGKQVITQIKVGNQALGEKPIALMTADELVYAGGKYDETNTKAYYYQNSSGNSVTGSTYWWTMSPYSSFSNNYYSTMFFLNGSSTIHNNFNLTYEYAVRPVLSLKSCVTVTGSGKTSDPYIPSIDDDCAAADN